MGCIMIGKFRQGERDLLRTVEPARSLAKRDSTRTSRGVSTVLEARQCETRSWLERSEPRAVTNLIQYIDLYEVPYGLRVQLKLSSYRLVVTTGPHLPR